MVTHVGYHQNVFEETEKAVNIWFAVFVVSEVEHEHERNTDEINSKNCFLVSKRKNFLTILRHETAASKLDIIFVKQFYNHSMEIKSYYILKQNIISLNLNRGCKICFSKWYQEVSKTHVTEGAENKNAEAKFVNFKSFLR